MIIIHLIDFNRHLKNYIKINNKLNSNKDQLNKEEKLINNIKKYKE